ncbi:alpha/beta hydrolase [Kribbella solani]|uniref:alpha/beta hydrolase n=1 Tax=Kribbella solani TaxID=236067 RepID=UPI0029A2AA49|nr:alpha/beta hydrolase [Kribbella solani]MDX2971163.1 alpha/beta hydrolase [Kribbella solani]MDX3006266.1 alpha/beta hydrolase [Kribbella solani]
MTSKSTYVLIHGGGDVGWSWHLVADELRGRGHEVLTPDLPGDESATFTDYADAVIDAVGNQNDVIVVGHSFGGYTAPMVADRLAAKQLVLVAAMIPAPGESPADWGRNTGYTEAVKAQAALDGGLTGSDDPYVGFLHDVPRELADEAMRRSREHPSPAGRTEPWPMRAWPDTPTRFVLCTEDRCFPPDFLRKLAIERLGVTPDEIAASHCVSLSRPTELAELLDGYAASPDSGAGDSGGSARSA